MVDEFARRLRSAPSRANRGDFAVDHRGGHRGHGGGDDSAVGGAGPRRPRSLRMGIQRLHVDIVARRDRRRPNRRPAQRGLPARLGFVAFSIGLVVASLAPGWPVLLVARAVQGFGRSRRVAYMAVARGVPRGLAGALLALLASAWIMPGVDRPGDRRPDRRARVVAGGRHRYRAGRGDRRLDAAAVAWSRLPERSVSYDAQACRCHDAEGLVPMRAVSVRRTRPPLAARPRSPAPGRRIACAGLVAATKISVCTARKDSFHLWRDSFHLLRDCL